MNRESKAILFTFLFILIVVLIIDYTIFKISGKLSLDGFMTEVHGMLLDVFVFGVLLSIYNGYKQKEEKEDRIRKQRIEEINSLRLELNDIKHGESEYVKLRIIYILKRLNVYGVEKFELPLINLSGIKIEGVKFKDSNLMGCDFSDCEITNVKFINCNLSNSSFEASPIEDVSFENSILTGVSFEEAELKNVIKAK